jgi:Protein of unknown function (DUF3102)
LPKGRSYERPPAAKIEAALEASFKRESRNFIEIGGLLNEAKEQLDSHGKWLPWLKARFPHAVRTAQNYMAAHSLPPNTQRLRI